MRETERGGKTTYGVYDECRRGQYMFSVMMREWGILKDTENNKHTQLHTETF